ncbi:MAG: transposase [Candidatus Latescibacterota bacterium]
MAEYTHLSFPFARIPGKKVVADFSGEQVTSDAGVLELREVADRIGLADHLVRAIHDSRHPGYITHSLRDLLLQHIFQIACGYEDANDANTLRLDPAFKTACDRLPSE